jgi:hypothetical protein
LALANALDTDDVMGFNTKSVAPTGGYALRQMEEQYPGLFRFGTMEQYNTELKAYETGEKQAAQPSEASKGLNGDPAKPYAVRGTVSAPAP